MKLYPNCSEWSEEISYKFNPNCSELVCRLDTKDLKLLDERGIFIIDYKDLPDDHITRVVFDLDNEIAPNLESYSYIDLDEDNTLNVNDKSQNTWTTMKKITDITGKEWESDSGSTGPYNEWIEDGCKPVDYKLSKKSKILRQRYNPTSRNERQKYKVSFTGNIEVFAVDTVQADMIAGDLFKQNKVELRRHVTKPKL